MPTFVSLFSGCGGLDLGLSRAGFRAILANDSDCRCESSFRANFPDVPFYGGSVRDLDRRLIRQLTGGLPREGVDLLAGGPPCPPYSKSRFYRKEKLRGKADPLALETLEGYLRVLKVIFPRAFLFENVPGFAYKVHRDALDHIVRAASSLGYRCSWSVLNAADYGVPQIRHRFFMIGVREGEFAFPRPTHVKAEQSDLFSTSGASWRTAGDAIGDLDTDENADDRGHFAAGKYNNLLKLVPPGQNYLYFTKERGYPKPIFRWRSRYWSFLLKLSPDLPSWTIQARRSNNMGPLHWRNRILRIAEVKRLQTFPDDWVLNGTIEQQWRQVGNAVPPILAEHLGRALCAALKTRARKKEMVRRSA